MKLLIDADVLCYAVAFTCSEEPVEVAERTMKGNVTDIIAALYTGQDEYSWELFLSGPSEENFRNEIAVTAPYKGNRTGKEKPEHHQALRDYLVREWNATVSVGQEADDDIATAATAIEDSVIVSIDKDFDQVPGDHYNPRKKEFYTVSEEEGLLWFYRQFLIGDAIDNIKGADGIGDVKSLELLEDKTEYQMWKTVVEILGYDRAYENALLLHLRRKPNEFWTEPEKD